jgi:hypothetical protein
VLIEFEIFLLDQTALGRSYALVQRHLEQTFGRPTSTTEGLEGYQNHKWKAGRVEIRHLVRDRFGPEEKTQFILTSD